MKPEEKNYLLKEKRNSGKDIKKSYEEINRLIESQKLFKEISKRNKSLERELSKKDNQIEGLKKQINKIKNQKFKKLFEPDRSSVSLKGTLCDVKRIFHHLERGKEYTATMIKDKLIMSVDNARASMELLISLGLAEKIRGGKAVWVYKLKSDSKSLNSSE